MAVDPLPLIETARRFGHYAWWEERLFELLGGWSATAPEPELRLFLGPRSHHHAEHAQRFRERLPVLHGTDPASFVVAPETGSAVVDALGRPEASIERLAGVYRVLVPRLVATYAAHVDATSPVTDGPTIRALGLILADELDEWRAGEGMLQSLIVTESTARSAARHQADIEALVAPAGLVAP